MFKTKTTTPEKQALPTALKTVEQLDNEIAACEAEHTAINDRQSTLAAQIADVYGQAAAEPLELEFAQLQGRAAALDILIERLKAQRREAFKFELLSAYGTKLEALVSVQKEMLSLNPEIDELTAKLHTLNVRYDALRQSSRFLAGESMSYLATECDSSLYGRPLLVEIQADARELEAKYQGA